MKQILILLLLAPLLSFSQDNNALEMKEYFNSIGSTRMENGSLEFVQFGGESSILFGDDLERVAYPRLAERMYHSTEFSHLFDMMDDGLFVAYWMNYYTEQDRKMYKIIRITVDPSTSIVDTIKSGTFKTKVQH